MTTRRSFLVGAAALMVSPVVVKPPRKGGGLSIADLDRAIAEIPADNGLSNLLRKGDHVFVSPSPNGSMLYLSRFAGRRCYVHAVIAHPGRV